MKRPNIWAHRGGRRWQKPAPPENSLAAFKLSLDASVYGIELDIHRCRSGELVVLHDNEVEHYTRGAGLVQDMTWNELRHLSLDPGGRYENERFPLLTQVITLTAGKCVLNIELKNAPHSYEGIEVDLLALIDRFGIADSVVVSSFDHEVLRKLWTIAPQIRLGGLVDGSLLDLGNYARRLGVECWHPCFDELTRSQMEAARRANLEVNVWTVNTPAAWESCIDLGVDGIITDDPVALKAHLDRIFA